MVGAFQLWTLQKKLQKNMCSLIRFAATVHLQKPRITNSSGKCAQFTIFR